MKRHTLKVIGSAALAVLMLATFGDANVSAQGGGTTRTLVGSWIHEVTLRNCETGEPVASFPAMMTFNHGGTIQQTAVPEPGSVALPGHGAWSHRAGGGYSAAFQFFILAPDGSLALRVVVRSDITLGPDGNSYTSTDTAELFSPNGIPLGSGGCSTTTATRFEQESSRQSVDLEEFFQVHALFSSNRANPSPPTSGVARWVNSRN